MIKTTTMMLTCACLSLGAFGQAVPPLTSTISGTVWQESKPLNGIRSISEKRVAGILVKLLDANSSDELVVASTLSDANGDFTLKANAGIYKIEYVYPTDGFSLAETRAGSDVTVNSAANDDNFTDQFTIGNSETITGYGLGLVAIHNTLTYCVEKPSTVTEWNESLLLPKSEVGTNPTNVKIFAAEAVYHPVISVENTGTATSFEITTAGKITMTMPITPSSFTMSSDVTLAGDLENFDSVEDYGGTSGETHYNRASYQVFNAARSTSSSSVINNTFVGAGTFAIPTKSQSTVTITSGGNLKTVVQTYVSAGACVVYTYPEGALPVKLASFNAKKEGETVNLTWTTSEEVGSDRFEIERSNDGKAWAAIGSVRAAGTTYTVGSYQFNDATPAAGQNLYRLKMVDFDGTFAYSAIKELSFKAKSAVYPNPAVATIQISDEGKAEVRKVSIYNAAGQLVKQVSKTRTVDVSTLSSGIYTVNTVYANGEINKASVVIAH